MKIILALLPLLLIGAPTDEPTIAPDVATAPPVDDPLAPLRPLVGRWKGESDGRFGKAQVDKTIAFAIQNRFLSIKTTSKGKSLHEDHGYWSYDKNKKAFVVREFHSEGFVNTYTVAVKDGGKTFEYVSDHVENPYAPKLKVKTVVKLVGKDELHESFCLANDGKTFVECFSMVLKRQ